VAYAKVRMGIPSWCSGSGTAEGKGKGRLRLKNLKGGGSSGKISYLPALQLSRKSE